MYFNKRKFVEENIKKYYIGQTTRTIKCRAGKDGSKYLGNKNSKFARAIKKWGWNSFELTILEENIENIDELNKLEMYYIEKYDSYNNGYNSTLGGEGQVGRKASEETIKKLKQSHLGLPSAMKGVKMTEESREKMSKAKKGKPGVRKGSKHSEETKRMMSEKFKGENNPNFGLKRSKETKNKMSESQKDRWVKVHCNELNITFDNTRLAVEYLYNNFGLLIKSRGNIFSVCKGYRKYCGTIEKDGNKINLTWSFVENFTNND